jgi:predicted permease
MKTGRSGFRLPFLTSARVAAEVDAELAFHLGMVTNELEKQGWSRSDAEQEARRRFGDVEFTRDYCGLQDIKRQRERNRMARIDELGKDFRYTLRSLRNAPGFALIVLVTLALGIGANTAIFSIVRAVLLEPLPFRDADRLVRVWHENKTNGVSQGLVSEPDFLDWRRESKVAESMGAFFYMDGLSGIDLTGDGPPARLSSALVAEGFFETLGTSPMMGRTIGHDDQLEGRNRVVVLGYTVWRDRFASSPDVLGRTIQMDNQAFTIIGVMPEHFAYPGDRNLDVWVPLSYFGPDDIGRGRGAQFQQVVARLRPGATEAQLRDELSSIAARLTKEYPDNQGWESVSVMSMRESIVGNVQRPLALLLGAVFLVLLITCANVASLLLARATSRRRELAVRAALGAGRARITRQLLTESLVLAIAGGALGTLLAYWGMRLVAANGNSIPRTASLKIDATVLLFTLGISVFAGVLFGVAPALRATGASLDKVLRAGGRGNIGTGVRLRSALVVMQVALAVVLVTAAALTTKSFARLLSVDMGFNPKNALFVEMGIPDELGSQDARRDYYRSILTAIRATPGVVSAGAIRDLPTRGKGEVGNVTIAGAAPNSESVVQRHQVSYDYFEAMQIPLKAGRIFTEADRSGAPLVVIVDEEFVRTVLGGKDPLTQKVMFGTTEVPIVGVVGSVRQAGAAQPIEPALYLHNRQNLRSRMSIVVRTNGEPLASANAVRQAIWGVNENQAIRQVDALENVLGASVSRPRLLASLFTMFGILGLSLGALGVYGVLAFSVQQRQQEIGVRVALGASPRSVQSMIVRQGLVLAGTGVLLGVVGSLAATGVIQGLLFGIEAADVATFAQVVIAVVITALLASWVPARRATTIDPMMALRNE